MRLKIAFLALAILLIPVKAHAAIYDGTNFDFSTIPSPSDLDEDSVSISTDVDDQNILAQFCDGRMSPDYPTTGANPNGFLAHPEIGGTDFLAICETTDSGFIGKHEFSQLVFDNNGYDTWLELHFDFSYPANVGDWYALDMYQYYDEPLNSNPPSENEIVVAIETQTVQLLSFGVVGSIFYFFLNRFAFKQ